MTFYKQVSSIGVRTFDDVVILVDPENGILHEMNEVGAEIWALCDGSRELPKIAEAIAEEFDVTFSEAEKDIQTFLATLEQRGLVERA